MKVYRLTREGHEMLLNELDDLIKNKRKEIADRLRDAKKSGGDLSENSEYEYAKNEQAFIEGRIEQINEILQNHIIIDEDNGGTHVDLGSTVVVKDMGSGKEKRYKVVSSIESDPEKNKISDESPIGSSLLNKKIGDEIIVKTPQDKKKFKIIDIV
ncbi:MAG: transcription elongation factor GreA [Actinomycetota bacterium]|jgi:transcription elongation factor GreA|nr:transcription elongation factor GreA [Actinomycetota bacterium]